MPQARLHDGNTIEIEVYGTGPALLLPVNPQPVTGPQAEEMRKYGADPALGQSLINGLSDAFRVVAFDYEGECLRRKTGHADTANTVSDLLAVADAAEVDQFVYYYSWLAMIGLQLAMRTNRLSALVMGGWPPLNGPYAEMLRVTTVSYEMASGMRPVPSAEESHGLEFCQMIRRGNLSRCTRHCKASMTGPLKPRSPVLVSVLRVRLMRSSTTSIGEMCLSV